MRRRSGGLPAVRPAPPSSASLGGPRGDCGQCAAAGLACRYGAARCRVAGVALSGAEATVGIAKAAGAVEDSCPSGGGAPVEAGRAAHPPSPVPGTAVSGKATRAAEDVSAAGVGPRGPAAGQAAPAGGHRLGQGGLVAQSRAPQPVEQAGDTSSVLCRFFNEGRCERDPCMFLHDVCWGEGRAPSPRGGARRPCARRRRRGRGRRPRRDGPAREPP